MNQVHVQTLFFLSSIILDKVACGYGVDLHRHINIGRLLSNGFIFLSYFFNFQSEVFAVAFALLAAGAVILTLNVLLLVMTLSQPITLKY